MFASAVCDHFCIQMWPSVAGCGEYNFLLSMLTRGLKSCQSKWISQNSPWQVDINIKRYAACDVGLCRLKIILKQGKIAFQKLCTVLKTYCFTADNKHFCKNCNNSIYVQINRAYNISCHNDAWWLLKC